MVSHSGHLFRISPIEHPLEQLHVASGRHIPAKVLGHIGVLQRPKALPVVPVQVDGAFDSRQEIIGIVALEGEAQAALAVLIAAGNGVLQAAGGMDHGHSAVAHGVHLAQAAGLGLAGHQIDVAAGINAGCQAQIEGDLRRHAVREFGSQLREEFLKLLFAGAQDQQLAIFLPQQLAGAVAQQIQALVTGQARSCD